LAVLLIAPFVPDARGDVSSDEVRRSIRHAIDFLISKQNPTGNWPGHPGQPGGLTSLCVLSLVNAGERPDSPAVSKAAGYLRNLKMPERVYAVAVQTMAFAAIDPDRDRPLIRRNADWLIAAQIAAGPDRGGWGYGAASGRADNSNTQFAMLALHEAERVGVSVRMSAWEASQEFWLNQQNQDGSWSYFKGRPPQLPSQQPSGSMTCAGVASLIIASGKTNKGSATITGDTVRCCGVNVSDDAVERGINWLGRKFSVDTNPGIGQYALYYLYGVERVGRLSGRRFLGPHDWYRAGAQKLLNMQDKLSGYWRGTGHSESNPLISTSFALLFLSKGLRPVAVSKLKYGDPRDANHPWDPHPGGVHQLTRHLEQSWRRSLTWQTIDVEAAGVNDLLQTPVLMISGRDGFRLSDQQIQRLREYVLQGGFIFVEQSCSGEQFDRDFRAAVAQMFPESSLRLLPPDHPVWFAESKVDPKYLPHIYGVDACCRTSIVYVPRDLTCHWQLARSGRMADYPAKVRGEIEAALKIGSNIVAYATNREFKDKLARPQTRVALQTEALDRGMLRVPKLAHTGGADDAPNALANLVAATRSQLQMRVDVTPELLPPTAEGLADHPIVFMHGRRAFRFSLTQRKALAEYLQQGGLVFADSICASKAFADSFRREIRALFPEAELTRLPASHPMFTKRYRGYDVTSVTVRDPQGGAEALKARLVKTSPQLEVLEIDGRIAVIFSPHDLSCALENTTSLECKSYIREDAVRIGVNVILFALQQ
jgi:hypothetical protein